MGLAMDYDRENYSGGGDDYLSLVETLSLHFDPVEEPEGGDVIVFRSRLMHNHMGLANGEGGVIHSYSGAGLNRVIEQPLTGGIDRRIARCFSMKGITWARL